jgi:hypothetical protein
MKNIIYAFILLLSIANPISAQRCGNIVTSIPPDTTITDLYTAFSPEASQLPCIDSGFYVSDTLYFYNNNFFQPDPNLPTFPIDLKFDSINNLPHGLCWETNMANDSFAYGQHGVILISGFCNDTIGRYQLAIKVNLYSFSSLSDSNFDITPYMLYFLQVKRSTSICPPLDTIYIRPVLPAYITPGRDTSICPGAMVTLTANSGSGYRYYWSTGDTVRSITVAGGYYTVSVYSGNALGVSHSISVYQENFNTNFQIGQDTIPHHFVISSVYQTYNGLLYIWSWGDMSIDTGRSIVSHSYTSAGRYNLCLTVVDPYTSCSATGCDSTPYMTLGDSITILPPRILIIGISAVNSFHNIKLYPNPASSSLIIESTLSSPTEGRIYNALGEIVQEVNISSLKTSVDITHLTEGVYYLSLKNNEDKPVSFIVAR